MPDTIGVQINIDARGANRVINQLNRNFNRTNASAQSAAAQVERTNKSINRGVNLLRLYAGAWIAVNAAMGAMRQISVIQNLTKQIDTVTATTDELNRTFEELQSISRDTRSDLQANTVLYQRLSFATEDLGATSKEISQVVRAVAAGLSLGGANAQEAASSIRQISQAFSKGKLDGDEFRSVMENAGFLMNEFRKILGLSRQELLEMSKAGELTSELLLKGFSQVADTLQQKVADMPMTLDQSINNLKTSWLGFLKVLNETGAFDALIDLIQGIGDALDWLAPKISEARKMMEAFGIVDPLDPDDLLLKQKWAVEELAEAQRKLNKAQADFDLAVQANVDPRLERQWREAADADIRKFNEERNKALIETERLNVLVAKAVNKRAQEEEEAKRVALDKEFLVNAEKRRKEEQKRLERLNFELELQEYADKLTGDILVKEQKRIDQQKDKELKLKQEEDAINSIAAAYEILYPELTKTADAEFQLMHLWEEGIITSEQYFQAMKKLSDGLKDDEPINALQRYAENVMLLEDVFVNAFKGMEDALVEFVMTGKLDFKSMIDSMIADLARMVIQQQITGPLAQMLGGAMGPTPTGGASGGGLIGSLVSGVMGLFGGGGSAPVVDRSFQHGGSFTVGGTGGPDSQLVAFRASPGENVAITPRGMGGGANIVVNMSINDVVDYTGFSKNQDQIINVIQEKMSRAQRNL